ncbi:fibronectin type III domain-containing protein [Homoserinibacter sp. YIM 151385]|uniref:fibronectin type III domain-containing protein n=1 Tax=Homoserinibacter sp. YIM 151385 TaxID=2985506 RepID=UPI0022F01A12|nr:hypothetical protein [Homoserinibacter sp. YIM 151385]WBU39141.1 hypothetical protein OF852_06085 [Homoserinibacter sp. YIM 151385]
MSPRLRLAALLGASIFLLLAAASGAQALWSTSAHLAPTPRVADLRQVCTTPVSIENGDLESPAIAPGSSEDLPDGSVPGWTARDGAGAAVPITLRASTPEGGEAARGAQYLELDRAAAGGISQRIATTPGRTLIWSFQHRARSAAEGVDLVIGAPGAGSAQGRYRDGGGGWVRYVGAYLVPAGQSVTELSIRPADPADPADAGGGILLDDVEFGTGPCASATTTVADVSAPDGGYTVGDVIELTTRVAVTGSGSSERVVLTAPLPSVVSAVTDAVLVDGAPGTDAPGDDTVTLGNGMLQVRLGEGADASVGGRIPAGTETVVRFRLRLEAASGGGSFVVTPRVSQSLVPGAWPVSVLAPTPTISVAAAVEPPSAPGAPSTSGTTTSGTMLAWAPSSGPGGVTAYRVYGDGVQIAEVGAESTTLEVGGLSSGVVYGFAVRAVDAAGNVSAASPVHRMVTAFDPAQRYLVEHPAGGLCAAAEEASPGTARLLQDTCDGAETARLWRLVATDDGWYRVTAVDDETLVWTIPAEDGEPSADGALALVAEWSGAEAQQFRPIPEEGGTLRLEVRGAGGGCVEVPGASAEPGVQLQQAACDPGPAQSFRMSRQ